MNEITSFPSRAYDYVHSQYGTVGLIVAGVMIVFGVVSLCVWFDRRK